MSAPHPLQVWLDGAFVDANSPQSPVTTHAMHYGSSVFEGIRSYALAGGGAAACTP